MTVVDCGPRDATIMLVGEAPGQEELRQGVPFCGQSGMLLKQMLLSAGIHFEQCYVTNLMNLRPPNNNFAYFYEEASRKTPTRELQTGIDRLHCKIKSLKPNIVICLGAEPLRAVLGRRGISTWRGSVGKLYSSKVIATYHPSAVLRDISLRPIVDIDLRKALEQSKTRKFVDVKPNIIIAPSIDDVVRFKDEFYAYHSKDKTRMLSFDIETYNKIDGLSVRCIALAFGRAPETIKSICIPFTKKSEGGSGFSINRTVVSVLPESPSVTSYWPPHLEVRVLSIIAELMNDKTVRKTGINSISFDQAVLENDLGITVQNHFLDAQHAHHCCYMEFPKSLDFMTTIYTPYNNYWTLKDTSVDQSEWTYNAMDAASSLVCAQRVLKEMEALKVTDLYFNQVHPLLFALARAEGRGVMIDLELRNKMLSDTMANIKNLKEAFAEAIGEDINMNSPKQLIRVLYDKLGLPPQRTRKGTVTTDEKALKRLAKKYKQRKELQILLQHRKQQKLASTYLSSKLDADNIMRTSYNASGTNTGRLSSSKTVRQTGGNLQNIPTDMRRYIVARKGRVFIKGDLSQADARVVAELLKKVGWPKLWKKYQQKDFDIHSWAAAPIFGCEESQVTKEQRAVGKLSNHSGNYGAGPRVLVDESIKRGVIYQGVLGISYEFSKNVLAARHKQLPGLKVWWKSIEAQLAKTRTLETCFGRKRIFFGRLDDATFRGAYGFIPQSTVADVTNQIFWKLDQLFDRDCYPLLQVHDEVVSEVPIEKIDYAIDLYKKVALIPLWINEDPLIIPISITVGYNWKETMSREEFRTRYNC